MAYDFSSLDNMMANQNNSNIFGQDGASGAQGSAQPQSAATMGAATGAQGSQAAAPKQQTAKQPANVGAEIAKKNKTPEAGANFVSGIQNQATQTKQNLQNEANQYVAGAQQKAQGYKVDTGQLDKAIGGDAEALSGAASRLSRQQADALDPYQQKVNPQLGDLNKISTDAGLQQYLKQRGGETYTGGMAALDQMLLSKDKNFQGQREGLANTQSQLMDEAKKTKQSAEQQAKDINEKAFQEETGKAKSYLGSKAQAEDEREAQEVAQERAAREALRQQAAGGKNAYLNEQANKVRSQLATNAQAFSPALLQHIQASNQVDPNQFYRVNDVAEGAGVTQEEADRMNRIQSLLGTGKTYQAGGGLGGRESFDANAYQAALTKLANQDLELQRQNEAAQQQWNDQSTNRFMNDTAMGHLAIETDPSKIGGGSLPFQAPMSYTPRSLPMPAPTPAASLPQNQVPQFGSLDAMFGPGRSAFS